MVCCTWWWVPGRIQYEWCAVHGGGFLVGYNMNGVLYMMVGSW